MNLTHKTAFAFYNLSWSLALPWLRLNQRLAEGYHQRVLKDKLPGVSDLWIQAASVGESFLALEILKSLQVEKPIQILLTANTRQGIDILNQALPGLIGGRIKSRRLFAIFHLTNHLLWQRLSPPSSLN